MSKIRKVMLGLAIALVATLGIGSTAQAGTVHVDGTQPWFQGQDGTGFFGAYGQAHFTPDVPGSCTANPPYGWMYEARTFIYLGDTGASYSTVYPGLDAGSDIEINNTCDGPQRYIKPVQFTAPTCYFPGAHWFATLVQYRYRVLNKSGAHYVWSSWSTWINGPASSGIYGTVCN